MRTLVIKGSKSLYRSSAASLTEESNCQSLKVTFALESTRINESEAMKIICPLKLCKWSSVCVSKMSGSSLSPLKLNCAPNNRPAVAVAGQRGAGPGKLFTFRLHLHSTPVGVPALEVATDLS